MLLPFLVDLTQTALTTPSLTYSLRSFYMISMCLVWHVVVKLLAINMASTLSTFTMTGCLATIFKLSRSWIMSITSITASDKATYSASELDGNKLFCNLYCQETCTPHTYITKPLMLLLLTGSLA